MAMKKIIVLIVFVVVVSTSLFADQWFTMSYKLLGTCSSVFWDPSTSGAGETPTRLTEVDVTNKTDTFATLGIIITGSKYVSIAVGFSPLYRYNNTNQTVDTSVTCPYSMTIYSPGTTTTYTEVASRDSVSETVNSQTITFVKAYLINNKKTNTIGVENNSGRAIADFKIEADTSSAAAGTYRGFLKCYITVGN